MVEVSEIRRPETNAQLVAESIAQQLNAVSVSVVQ
jgi:ribosomal protein S3